MSKVLEKQRQDLIDWIEVLESNKYKQGIGNLCRRDKFCCLGVLLNEKCTKPKNTTFIGDGEFWYFKYGRELYELLPPKNLLIKLFGKLFKDKIKVHNIIKGNYEDADITVIVDPNSKCGVKLKDRKPATGADKNGEMYYITSLSDLNDHGFTFKEIAHIMRQNFVPDTLPEKKRLRFEI